MKRAWLLSGYGPIERPEWLETLELYRMYCVLEFWGWLAQWGNREPLAQLSRDLEAFV
jgi:hypothetical protein